MTQSPYILALPEIYILAMACFVLMAGTFVVRGRTVLSYSLTQMTLIGAAIITLLFAPSKTQIIFDGAYISDSFGVLSKMVVYGLCFFVFCYANGDLRRLKIPHTEFYVLSLFSMLGMMVMISAHSLLMVYLGVELLSLPLYALVALQKSSPKASEAAMKYFVLGALASGFLLYGLSLLYGVTHTLSITNMANVLVQVEAPHHTLVEMGMIMVVAGLVFKLGMVPFHMWIPDVYEGSPTIITSFVATAPKVAAFALLIRVLVEGLPALQMEWHIMLIGLASLSIFMGNIMAIAQTNVKRLLAYSSIAHAGYLVLGLIAGTHQGYSASLFYAITYALTVLGGFGLLSLLRAGGADIQTVDDLRGLNQEHPWMAFLMLVIIFSMAGIPPALGFFAKLSVLYTLIVAKNLVWLAVFAVVMAVVGAYYYLRVIKMMYFDKPVKEITTITRLDTLVAISTNGLLVLCLGIFPSILIDSCRAVFMA